MILKKKEKPTTGTHLKQKQLICPVISTGWMIICCTKVNVLESKGMLDRLIIVDLGKKDELKRIEAILR